MENKEGTAIDRELHQLIMFGLGGMFVVFSLLGAFECIATVFSVECKCKKDCKSDE